MYSPDKEFKIKLDYGDSVNYGECSIVWVLLFDNFSVSGGENLDEGVLCKDGYLRMTTKVPLEKKDIIGNQIFRIYFRPYKNTDGIINEGDVSHRVFLSSDIIEKLPTFGQDNSFVELELKLAIWIK